MRWINIEELYLENDNYPRLLKEIKNAPERLYIEGNQKVLNMPCITVVGSRNMTEYGKKITIEIVKELINAGVCIVSGLAVGIDTVAHQTCIENNGKTIHLKVALNTEINTFSNSITIIHQVKSSNKQKTIE